MKVLYVSDLDGTLLNRDRKLDVYSQEKLNMLIDNGLNFTVATGRGDSVRSILKELNLKLPVLLLNGAVKYDFEKDSFLDEKPLPTRKVLEIEDALNGIRLKSFEVQLIKNNELDRIEVSDWDRNSICLGINLLLNTEDVQKLKAILSSIKDIEFFMQKRVYTEGEWYCDIMLKGVSKGSTLKEFKEKYNFDKVIAFGDSENDLPLCDVADEFYAPQNATDIVKENSTNVIGSAFDNGVVKFILGNFEEKQK